MTDDQQVDSRKKRCARRGFTAPGHQSHLVGRHGKVGEKQSSFASRLGHFSQRESQVVSITISTCICVYNKGKHEPMTSQSGPRGVSPDIAEALGCSPRDAAPCSTGSRCNHTFFILRSCSHSSPHSRSCTPLCNLVLCPLLGRLAEILGRGGSVFLRQDVRLTIGEHMQCTSCLLHCVHPES